MPESLHDIPPLAQRRGTGRRRARNIIAGVAAAGLATAGLIVNHEIKKAENNAVLTPTATTDPNATLSPVATATISETELTKQRQEKYASVINLPQYATYVSQLERGVGYLKEGPTLDTYLNFYMTFAPQIFVEGRIDPHGFRNWVSQVYEPGSRNQNAWGEQWLIQYDLFYQEVLNGGYLFHDQAEQRYLEIAVKLQSAYELVYKSKLPNQDPKTRYNSIKSINSALTATTDGEIPILQETAHFVDGKLKEKPTPASPTTESRHPINDVKIAIAREDFEKRLWPAIRGTANETYNAEAFMAFVSQFYDPGRNNQTQWGWQWIMYVSLLRDKLRAGTPTFLDFDQGGADPFQARCEEVFGLIESAYVKYYSGACPENGYSVAVDNRYARADLQKTAQQVYLALNKPIVDTIYYINDGRIIGPRRGAKVAWRFVNGKFREIKTTSNPDTYVTPQL